MPPLIAVSESRSAGPAPSPMPATISAWPWLDRLRWRIATARTGDDPEGVHGLRVAEARLRVWLALGGRRALQEDLRWLRHRTALMRDLDVALAQVPPEHWAGRLRERWVEAHASLLEALDHPRVAGLLNALALLPPVPRGQAERAASRLARTTLRRGAGVWKHGTDTDALHRLRRTARRLRYALEWIGRDAEPIQELQDALGQACDRVVALRRLADAPATNAGYRRELEEALREELRHGRRVWRRTRPTLRELGRS